MTAGFSGPMADRALIRELYGAYADATDRMDAAAWLALWTPGAVRRQDGREVVGHAALQAFWDSIFGYVEQMAFFTEIGATQVDGDRATARVWCREIVKLRGGNLLKVVGRYDDALERLDGAWLFARRDYTVVIDEH